MYYQTVNNNSCFSFFKGCVGAKESFAILCSESNEDFNTELEELYALVRSSLDKFSISLSSLVFSRLYVTDIANQLPCFKDSSLFDFCNHGAFSVVQQAPLGTGQLVILLYFIEEYFLERDKSFPFNDSWCNSLKVSGENYSFIWLSNLCNLGKHDSYLQSDNILNNYISFLESKYLSLKDNVIRTWFYIRDIDNQYQGVVNSRKKIFEENGLTKNTHYIASTGIEGCMKDVDSLVSLDALALHGVSSKQVIQLEALNHMNPTHEYGVTFERGTKIIYGDREHYYISGTASIDNKGNVVHVGNIRKQTLRTIDNINALLEPHGVKFSDFGYLIVYLRNHKHITIVENILKNDLDIKSPIIVIKGAVCRPEWLIEIEGVAIKRSISEFPPLM